MSKPKIHVPTLVISLIVVGIGVSLLFMGLAALNKSQDEPAKDSSQQSSSEVALVDPEGVYTIFSDVSITKKPDEGVKFGNGQTLTFEYDGSKSDNDEAATISYQLFYIQDDGKVQPMGGGNVEGRGSGVFTVSDKVFNSNAKDRKGFMELTVTSGTKFDGEKYSGRQEQIGMYPITFDVSE